MGIQASFGQERPLDLHLTVFSTTPVLDQKLAQ